MSQKQEILHSHWAQIPITPNQLGTFEMRESNLANAGDRDEDNSDYELSDLGDIEIF